MAYTNVWDNAAPLGSQAANLIDDDLRALKLDIGERLTSIFGIGSLNALDPVLPLLLKLTGSATSKIIPGATSLSLRNNADTGDNLLIADAGTVTIGRGGLTLSSGNPPLLITKDASGGLNRYIRLTDTGVGGKQWDLVNQGDSGKSFLIYNNSDSIICISVAPAGQVSLLNTLTISAGGASITGTVNIGGNTAIAGSLLVNGNAGAAIAELRGAASNKRSLFYTTGGSVRWEAFTDQNAESGSNAGSNYQLARYNDAGTFLDNAISIFRSTGVILFTSTAQSRFQLTGVANGAMVSALDLYGSSAGVPGTYNRAGGLELQYTAGAISGFGIFADSVNLEIKSTDTSKTVTILNSLSVSTTGVASATPMFILNKDNAASTAIYGQILRQGVAKAYFGLDSGDNFCFFDTSAINKIIQLGNNGTVTIGTQTGYPSANFTDGSNTLELGWTSNIFFFKQTQVTNRTVVFRSSGNTDILTIDPATGIVTANVGVFNAVTGFRIGGGAAAGRFLRGDGTNFISSVIVAGDLPTALTPTTLTVGGGQTVSRILSATLTWNPGAINVNAQAATTLTVAGAQVGDAVLMPNIWLTDNIFAILQATVTSANTVTVQITNNSSGTITLTNRSSKAWVIG